MSTQFWLKLLFACLILPLAIFMMKAYRKGVFKELRAKWLRRRIVKVTEALIPQISAFSEIGLREHSSSDHYILFRLRAELEGLHKQSGVLLGEERVRLAEFLANLSTFVSNSEAGNTVSDDMHELILLGQRVMRESTELGF